MSLGWTLDSSISRSHQLEPGIGNPLTVTIQFYQENSGPRKLHSLESKRQFNGLAPVGKIQGIRCGNVNQLLRRGVTNFNEEGNLAKSLNQPGIDHKVGLDVRKRLSIDGVEDPNQVGLSARKAY